MEEMNRQIHATNRTSNVLHTKGMPQQRGELDRKLIVNHVVKKQNDIIVEIRVTLNKCDQYKRKKEKVNGNKTHDSEDDMKHTFKRTLDVKIIFKGKEFYCNFC